MSRLLVKALPKQLIPCPFCGAGKTETEVLRLQPTMSGGERAVISARIKHWCEADEKRRLQSFIDIGGRTEEEAIEIWNTRAKVKRG